MRSVSSYFDWQLILPVLILSLMGLAVLGSIAPQLVGTQMVFFLFSVLVFVVLAFVDYALPFSLHIIPYTISLAFLVLPYFIGLESRGAMRWLQVGSFSLQPSELVKPFLLITFSVLVSLPRSHAIVLFLSAALPLCLVFFQPDLGTTLVLLAGFLTILFYRASLKKIFLVVLLGTVSAVPGYHFFLREYQRDRLITFVNPYRDPLGNGYHVIQSVIAIGSGGLLGRGLGHGTQSQLRFLPEHHTDFIFASLSEELGLVGAACILIVSLFLIHRIYRISKSSSQIAPSLFCLAVAAMLAFQYFVNIGMNMGLAPVTGITLPFLSYGGSSLLSLGLSLGVVNSISRHNRKLNQNLI